MSKAKVKEIVTVLNSTEEFEQIIDPENKKLSGK